MTRIDRTAPVALMLAADTLTQLEGVVANLHRIYGPRLIQVGDAYRDREGSTVVAVQILALEAARAPERDPPVRLVHSHEEGL